MKRVTSVLTLTVAVAGLFALTGCQTVSTTNNQYIGVQQFPPTNPMQVQILRTEPTRPNIKLGEVRAEPSSENVDAAKIEMAIQKAAAKMGADAAVVVYDKTQVVGAQVVGGWLNREVDPIVGRIVIAIAIKYQ